MERLNSLSNVAQEIYTVLKRDRHDNSGQIILTDDLYGHCLRIIYVWNKEYLCMAERQGNY